ncbi:LIM/homeobox protein Lhx4-like isoform X2 [Corticium candelabrum]|uniref:LIM/homeobox protein Lhx4-like isoform X2 n=1 Tax=Corticium candelabrum TaxID=121492 RepID=UPI002E276046|nr:LIM/homeobox protein Lhx4-like isoform X2 [Corticium candelabrum]
MDETEGEETGLEGEDTTKPQSCAGCSRPIRGRYVYKVLEKTWHAGCVCCHDCRLPLSEKCYCRDELLFCKDHFYRRYGIKCTACGEGIPPTTLVRRAIDNVYHMHCFKCNTCERQLETGDEFFLMEDGKVVCKEDQEKAKDPDDAEFTVKRPRTSISTEQKDALKVVYAKNTRPTRTVREDLARATGLPARVVQVWFQNKRAKERRCQKETFELTKARQGSSKLKREGKSKTKSRTVSKRPRTTETQSSVSETEQHQGSRQSNRL